MRFRFDSAMRQTLLMMHSQCFVGRQRCIYDLRGDNHFRSCVRFATMRLEMSPCGLAGNNAAIPRAELSRRYPSRWCTRQFLCGRPSFMFPHELPSGESVV